MFNLLQQLAAFISQVNSNQNPLTNRDVRRKYDIKQMIIL